MQDSADSELLRQYVHRDSNEAFAALLARHVDLVFSVALRRTGSPQAAEEITQVVFIILAKKARALPEKTVLSGWLYHTARLTAVNFLRAEIRRARREQEAHMQSLATETEPDVWPQIMPLLEDAMARLGEKDRDAIVLRFFEGKSFAEIASAAGGSENAAKKRVHYSLEKLRRDFAKRGVVSSASALAGAIATHSVQAAPAGLIARLAAAQAGAAVSGGAAALAAAVLRQMLWAKLRLVFGCGAAAVVALVLLKLLVLGPAPGPAPQPAAPQAGSPSPAPVAETAPARTGTAAPSTAARPAGKVFFLHIRAAADNQPVPNAGVILDCWGQGGVVHEANFRSDTDGLCEMPMPAVAFRMFRVWVSAEGFVPKVMEWKAHELEDPATSYTTRLDRGLTLAGVVQDEQGTPAAGVKIAFTGPGIDSTRRENVALYSPASVIHSDASGQFVSHQMPSFAENDIGVAVSHPDFAAQWIHTDLPESLRTNWVIVLNRGLPLPGRVVNAQGGPVSGATVRVPEPHGGVDVSATSDGEGNFTLLHMPLGPVQLEVRAAGFKDLKRHVLVESNAAPVRLELQPESATVWNQLPREPIHFHGTVVDADSGAAIPRFKVLLDERRSVHDLLGEGRDGVFNWESPLTFASEYTLEVDADGYEPQASSVRQRADGDQTFEFRLRRGGLLAGQVLRPDGKSAAGAAVGLDSEGDDLHLRFQPPAGLVSYSRAVSQTNTDSQGAFSLKSMVGATSILAVHDSGWAVVPARPGTNLVIQLETWGSIEGTVYIGSTPTAGQMIDLWFESPAYAVDRPALQFGRLSTKSDSDGQFRIERVPPGSPTVFRFINFHEGTPGPTGHSQGQPVTVRPGETAQVTLGGKGRPVIGRFVLSQPPTNYNWRANLVALVQDRPELVLPQRPQFPSSRAYFKAWGAYYASIANYYLDFQTEGTFRVDDVPPGQYTLTLRVTAPPADPLSENAWTEPGPVLGGITNTVVVPPMSSERVDEPLDLGAILVPMVDTPALSNAAGKH